MSLLKFTTIILKTLKVLRQTHSEDREELEIFKEWSRTSKFLKFKFKVQVIEVHHQASISSSSSKSKVEFSKIFKLIEDFYKHDKRVRFRLLTKNLENLFVIKSKSPRSNECTVQSRSKGSINPIVSITNSNSSWISVKWEIVRIGSTS